MGRCETCGNEYDKSFDVTDHHGDKHTFDSFECAIHAMAPNCDVCGVRIVGHGTEADGRYFCCAHCAEHAGVSNVADRA